MNNNSNNLNPTNKNFVNNVPPQPSTLNNNNNQNNEVSNTINQQKNKFINQNAQANNTSLADLNVDGSYNKLDRPSYVNDSQIKDNVQEHKKNTVTVSKELKTVIIIAVILLIFVIFLPTIFDYVNDINFN